MPTKDVEAPEALPAALPPAPPPTGLASSSEHSSDADSPLIARKKEDDGGPKDARLRLAGTRRLLAISFYMVAGPSTIFLNKHILAEVHFPFGAALSLLGISTSTVVAAVAVASGRAESEKLRQLTPGFYLRRVFPIGMAMAGTLALGNTAYLYNSVAFVQMLKAFAPVILITLLFVTRLERPRTLLVVAIVTIVVGTALSARGEVAMSPLGVALMLASEFFEAVKLVNMQLLLDDFQFGNTESILALGPAAIVALALTSLATEDVGLALGTIAAYPWTFFVASWGGVAVNFSTSMVVKTTSALSLRILSVLRNLMVIFVSATILQDSIVTPLEVLGLVVSLTGMFIYQYSKPRPNEDFATSMRFFNAAVRRTLSLDGAASASSSS